MSLEDEAEGHGFRVSEAAEIDRSLNEGERAGGAGGDKGGSSVSRVGDSVFQEEREV